jgi:transcriptional regulator with XRE-family HTH domain
MEISVGQIKQARALLAWSQDDIAIACGLDTATLVNFELGKQFPKRQIFEDIRATLKAAGVEFGVEGAPAVTLRKAAKRFRPTPTKSNVGTVEGERYFDYLLSEFSNARVIGFRACAPAKRSPLGPPAAPMPPVSSAGRCDRETCLYRRSFRDSRR